jgi:hypothetical protein
LKSNHPITLFFIVSDLPASVLRLNRELLIKKGRSGLFLCLRRVFKEPRSQHIRKKRAAANAKRPLLYPSRGSVRPNGECVDAPKVQETSTGVQYLERVATGNLLLPLLIPRKMLQCFMFTKTSGCIPVGEAEMNAIL